MPGADSSDVVGRSLCSDDSGRTAMRHIDYLEMMLRNGHAMAHDYSHQSTDEDPHMIAFFDSLVRRERDGWSSDEDEESISRDDDIDDHALDYRHTEQSSSDDSASDGNRQIQSGVVFRPLRYPQARLSGSTPFDGTPSVEQSTAVNSDVDRNSQSRVRRRRKSRRAMLQRLGQMIPITSFVSSHSPTEDSSSDSTTTTTVDSSSSDSDESKNSSSSSLSESLEPVDRAVSRDPSDILDPCRETADPLMLKQSRDSLSRLKRLRERALNSDDDSGEFSSSAPSAAKCPANSNLLPVVTADSVCDNLLDGCKSPVKLNGKSESCSDSADVTEINQVMDFPRNNVASESHEGASVSSSVFTDSLAVQSSGSVDQVDQELCSILNQVPNGEAAEIQSSSSERFRSRRQRTKSGSRRYRRTVVDIELDYTSDED